MKSRIILLAVVLAAAAASARAQIRSRHGRDQSVRGLAPGRQFRRYPGRLHALPDRDRRRRDLRRPHRLQRDEPLRARVRVRATTRRISTSTPTRTSPRTRPSETFGSSTTWATRRSTSDTADSSRTSRSAAERPTSSRRSPDVNTSSDTRFTAAIGGGIKYFFDPHFALRLDGRALLDVPRRHDGPLRPLLHLHAEQLADERLLQRRIHRRLLTRRLAGRNEADPPPVVRKRLEPDLEGRRQRGPDRSSRPLHADGRPGDRVREPERLQLAADRPRAGRGRGAAGRSARRCRRTR